MEQIRRLGRRLVVLVCVCAVLVFLWWLVCNKLQEGEQLYLPNDPICQPEPYDPTRYDLPVDWPKVGPVDAAIYRQLDSRRPTLSDTTCLTLTAGSREVVWNGQTVTLEHPALLHRGQMLFPAQEVLELLGGTIRLEPETGLIRVYYNDWQGCTVFQGYGVTFCWLDSREIALRPAFDTEITVLEHPEAAPALRNGTVYFPSELIQVLFSGWEFRWVEPGRRYFICRNGSYDAAAGGVVAGQPYLTVPEELRGELEKIFPCPRIYGNRDITMLCAPSFPGEDEVMRIIWFTVHTDRFCTPRGLRIGDTVEKVYELYGFTEPPEYGNKYRYGYPSNELWIEVKNGRVTSFSGTTT